MMLPWLRRLAAGLEQARRDRAARRAEDAARLAALSKPPEPPVDPIDELMRIVGEQEPDPPRRAKVLAFPRRRR